MAHKKGMGSTKNGRDSESKRLGAKMVPREPTVSLSSPATSLSDSAEPRSTRVPMLVRVRTTPCSPSWTAR